MIVSVRKGCFTALAASICWFACDSDLWSSPRGQPEAVNFRVAKVCGEFKETPPVKMDSALGQALDSLRISIEESNAAIEREELPEVEGDDVQLAQLFQNLIGNAIKFRKKGTPLNIRISLQLKENEWVFGVHDNGIGIEPRFFGNIFEIFRRLHTREEYEGSGIGLAICRKIVERHGGRVWVESTYGEGSSFYFTMPVRRDRNKSVSA